MREDKGNGRKGGTFDFRALFILGYFLFQELLILRHILIWITFYFGFGFELSKDVIRCHIKEKLSGWIQVEIHWRGGWS